MIFAAFLCWEPSWRAEINVGKNRLITTQCWRVEEILWQPLLIHIQSAHWNICHSCLQQAIRKQIATFMSQPTPNYAFLPPICSVNNSSPLSLIVAWTLAIHHFCATNFHTQRGSNLGIFSDSRRRWDVFLSLRSHAFVRTVSEAKTLMSARGHARLLTSPTLSVSALSGSVRHKAAAFWCLPRTRQH